MSVQSKVDQAKVEVFVERVLGDTSATLTTLLAILGDRLDLFKNLAEKGPATKFGIRRSHRDERALRPGMAGRNGKRGVPGI